MNKYPDNIFEQWRLYIEALIEQENITQNHIAKTLGVNPSQVSRWKTGQSKPQIKHIKRAIDAFNLPLDFYNVAKEPNVEYNDQAQKAKIADLEQKIANMHFQIENLKHNQEGYQKSIAKFTKRYFSLIMGIEDTISHLLSSEHSNSNKTEGLSEKDAAKLKKALNSVLAELKVLIFELLDIQSA